MHRAIGAGCVVVGGFMYGLGLARSMQARVREISDLIGALQVLETEIAFAHAPLPEACDTVAHAMRGTVRRLFRLMTRRFSAAHDLRVADIWREVISMWAEHAHLQAEELNVLLALGTTLGRSGTDEQVRTLRYTADRLMHIRQRLEGDLEKQSRLRLYLGVAGGVVLAILLV